MDISGISIAKEGYAKASEKLVSSVEKIASGDTSSSVLIDFAMNASNLEVQTKNLGLMLDRDKNLLDILA